MTKTRLAVSAGALALVLTLAGVLVWSSARGGEPHGENAGPPVLVATKLIPKGTPGAIVESKRMYAPVTLPAEEVEAGAVANPSYLAGRAAVVDIARGQQLTSANFAKR